jgi:hypothetical protein
MERIPSERTREQLMALMERARRSNGWSGWQPD